MMSMAMTSILSLSNPHTLGLHFNHHNNIKFVHYNLNYIQHPKQVRIKCSSTSPPAAVSSIDLKPLESALDKKDSEAVKEALDKLNEVGWAKRWSSQPYVSRRTTSLRELTTLGIKNAEALAIPSVRNDWWAQQGLWLLLPVSFLGLLQAAIDGYSSFFPDYQERIARHEAAHFLVAYLLGIPILGYSLDIGKEHVNLIDEKLEKLIYSGQLDAQTLDRLAVVSMAGLAAEGLTYDKVIGQSADLFTLQRFINRFKPPINKQQQQNLTRWAVLFAASLVKTNQAAYEALMAAMSKKATVLECIKAVETA